MAMPTLLKWFHDVNLPSVNDLSFEQSTEQVGESVGKDKLKS